MFNNTQQKLNQKIQELIDKATQIQISSNILFDTDQIALLQQLNTFCVNQVLDDIEIIKDPRKIMYKSNEELKTALIAILLSRVLTNHRSKQKYNKEFFENNINIYTDTNGIKNIIFNQIDENEVDKSINHEIMFDWMIFRDKEGRGIHALIDEKTFNCGLDDFNQGGDPIYEFARFQRKYFEYKHRQELHSRENAQEAFRNTIMQQAAIEVAKQQILSGQNPIELVNLLFNAKDYNQAIQQILVSPQTNSKMLQAPKPKKKKKKQQLIVK